jgi:hypothetical protein
MPVVDTTPLVVASPNAWVSASNSAPVRPASARTVARAGSTRMPFMGDKSIMNPPSHTLLPAALSGGHGGAAGRESVRHGDASWQRCSH